MVGGGRCREMGDGMGEIGPFMDILGWVPPKHALRQGCGTRVDSARGPRLPPQNEEAVLWGNLTMQNRTSTVLTKESGSGAILPSAFLSHLDEGGSRKCYPLGISGRPRSRIRWTLTSRENPQGRSLGENRGWSAQKCGS